jgi:hypothetical protein
MLEGQVTYPTVDGQFMTPRRRIDLVTKPAPPFGLDGGQPKLMTCAEPGELHRGVLRAPRARMADTWLGFRIVFVANDAESLFRRVRLRVGMGTYNCTVRVSGRATERGCGIVIQPPG